MGGHLVTLSPVTRIVDTSINDLGSNPAGFRKLLQRLHSLKSNVTGPECPPAVLYVQEFRTCPSRYSDCRGHCQADTIAQLGNSSVWWCPSFWTGVDPHVRYARELGWPVASYRDAVWANFSDPPADLRLFWNGCKWSCQHPDAVTQQLVSDVVKHALSELIIRPISKYAASESLALMNASPVTGGAQFCALRSSQFRMHADDPEKFQPTSQSGNWKFTSDRPGKFGWIGRLQNQSNPLVRPPTLSISFPVYFSDFPRLEVQFGRSYEGFYDARVFLSCCKKIDDIAHNGPPPLQGWWSHHYSQPDTVSWHAGPWEPDGHGAFSDRILDESCECSSSDKPLTQQVRVAHH
jgi:hypothetical protein